MSAIVQYSEHSLALPFFGTGMKTDLFQSCGHCWVFHLSDGKKSVCNVGDPASILGLEDCLKAVATHSSILAWRIPWIEKPSSLQSMESQRVRHNWMTDTFTFPLFEDLPHLPCAGTGLGKNSWDQVPRSRSNPSSQPWLSSYSLAGNAALLLCT